MKARILAGVTLVLGVGLHLSQRPRSEPCNTERLVAAFSDSATGQHARAFSLGDLGAHSRALVAVYPFGPTWSGYVVLASCEGEPLDTLRTGGVDTVVVRNVTGLHRPEALIYGVAATGTGARTSVLSIIAVIGDSLHLLWARPYWDYFYGPLDGAEDTAEVTFPRPRELLVRGSSQAFRLDSAADSMIPAGPVCRFSDVWIWQAKADTFAPKSSVQTRERCKAV